MFIWAILIAALVAAAYLIGASLARQWKPTSMARPVEVKNERQTPSSTSTQVVAAAWLEPGMPVDGMLAQEAIDRWQFQGVAGQSVTLEMWLHPGTGSSVDAELQIQLFATDGTSLANEAGSVFLPPYLVSSALPTDDLYYVEISPTSGAPGRYSLLLTLSDPAAPSTPGAPSRPRQPTITPNNTAIAASQGMFQWPTRSRAISGWTFHDPGNPGHIGLDIAANMWDPIVAAAGGLVVFADWGGGYGNLVVLEHADGWTTYYAHFSEIVVEAGQNVQRGELLGGAGSTGYSTGSHLHFEIRYQGRPVDPHIYLP